MCTVHVITVGIETYFCYVDAFIALLNGSVVFHLHHGHNTAAVGQLLASGHSKGATYTWGLCLRTGFTTISVFHAQYTGI